MEALRQIIPTQRIIIVNKQLTELIKKLTEVMKMKKLMKKSIAILQFSKIDIKTGCRAAR